MMCAAAYVGAVTHTFSSGVLILELTGEMDYCLHVMLATSIAVTFSRAMSDSIFKKIIDMRSLPFIDEMLYIPEPILGKDIMSKNITPINKKITHKGLRAFLKGVIGPDSKNSEFVFPVVTQYSNESPKFIGSITKEKLVQTLAIADEKSNLLNDRESDESDDEAEKIYDDRDKRKIKLKYEKQEFSVLDDTPLEQIHMFFVTGHLRFVFVTHNGIPVGIITREDVGNALKHQHLLA